MPTYLVESYATETSLPDQRERASRAADARPGITYLRMTNVPGDQTVLHLFEADSSAVLEEAVAVAGLDCDRIVEVVETAAR
jgi:hypothetical protein